MVVQMGSRGLRGGGESGGVKEKEEGHKLSENRS